MKCFAWMGILIAFAATALDLENGHVRYTFDDDTYGLSAIYDKDNGFTLDFLDGAPLWLLTIKDTAAAAPDITWSDDYEELRSTHRNAYRSSSQQTLSGEQVLHLDWTDFPLPNGDQASFHAEVHLADDAREAVWTFDVETVGTNDALWRADYPALLLAPIDGTSENDLGAVPIGSGVLVPNPYEVNVSGSGSNEITDSSGHLGGHPGKFEMQWVQVYDADSRRGLFVRSDDADGYAKGITMGPYGGHAAIVWRHYPENNTSPNRSYAPTYTVRTLPMTGDWFDGAKYYRQWTIAQSWCAQGPLTTRAGFPGDVFEDLALILFTDVADFSSTDEIYDSHEAWRDFMAPDGVLTHLRGVVKQVPDPEVTQTARDAFAQFTDWGYRVAPYTNTHDWWRTTPDNADGTLNQGVQQNVNGEWFYSPEFDAYKMCPGDAQWRQHYIDVLDLAAEAGATDAYCDLYPSARLCFASHHGHPLGGGRWWLDGYRTMLQQARTAARVHQSDFITVPEHRSETTLDLFEAYSVNYWTYLDHVFRGGIDGGIPTPITAAVMHDYIAGIAATQVPYDLIGSAHFRFAHAFSFVNGNTPTVYHDARELAKAFPAGQARDYDFMRTIARYRLAMTDYLLYGEYLRPPDTGSGTRAVVMYDEPFQHPIVLGGAFRSPAGDLGVFMANDNLTSHLAEFTIARADYALGDGTYEIWSVTPDARTFYGGFRGSDYVRRWFFNAGGLLMLEVLEATDTDGDGMSDRFENEYGLNATSSADAAEDGDGDGLTNAQEFANGTDPTTDDSDGDGFNDADEVAAGSDPNTADEPVSLSGGGWPFAALPLMLLAGWVALGRVALRARRHRTS